MMTGGGERIGGGDEEKQRSSGEKGRRSRLQVVVRIAQAGHTRRQLLLVLMFSYQSFLSSIVALGPKRRGPTSPSPNVSKLGLSLSTSRRRRCCESSSQRLT